MLKSRTSAFVPRVFQVFLFLNPKSSALGHLSADASLA